MNLRWFGISLVGHLVVLVVGSFLSGMVRSPLPPMETISVGLAVAPAQAQPTVPDPPPEIERPAPDPVPDTVIPPDDPEPEPVLEEPEPELPTPPAPPELDRPRPDPVPDPVPAEVEVEETVEPVDLAPPDPDLPPEPTVQERSAREERTASADSVVSVPEPPAHRSDLGEGAAVAATSSEGVDDGYLVRVQQKIGRLWQPTPASALGQRYVTTVVSFRIRPDGQVQAPAVSETSGLSVFDRQALRAVFDASPLPPLPPRFPDGVSINFRFEYER